MPKLARRIAAGYAQAVRLDFHIVRELRRWQIQTAQGMNLAAFDDAEAALKAACAHARQLEEKGLSARVLLHMPGKAPEVFDYPSG
jgi:hypothetical protein